jgi:hypothetical protein
MQHCAAAVSALAVDMTTAPVTNSLCCEEAVPETLKRMVALRWRREEKVDCAENTSAVGWTKPAGVGVLGWTADGDSIAVWGCQQHRQQVQKEGEMGEGEAAAGEGEEEEEEVVFVRTFKIQTSKLHKSSIIFRTMNS